MSLILSMLDDLDHEMHNPFYDFGIGLHPHHVQHQPRRHHDAIAAHAMPLGVYNRPLVRRNMQQNGGPVSTIGKDGFQVCMDVAQFKPSELNVKVVDKHIIVEGKHEERADNHGYISRHFVRRYSLPKGYDSDKVVSTLSSDGVLTVSVPKPQLEDKS
ncbi:heat shock protein 26-like, partial [Teleopsis dalmanni]